MTTPLNPGQGHASDPGSGRVPHARLTLREVLAELARAEDDLRHQPDSAELAAEVRTLVRELRRRAARRRLLDRGNFGAPRREDSVD